MMPLCKQQIQHIEVIYWLDGPPLDGEVFDVIIVLMSNELKIPQILTEQRGFCLRIDENNTKLFGYIEYLKSLVTSMHAICQKLCKRVLTATEDVERRMLAGKLVSPHGLVILGFVRGLSLLHLTINNQLSSNSVTLGTKSHKVARNRLEILRQKLVACDGLNRQYLQKVEVFNKKERSLREKCEYFNDYEKDVLKYYSLKANTELFQQLTDKELRLRERLEQISRTKDEYKINIAEIRVTIREYYEMELAMLTEYKRLLLNIRKGSATRQVYNQPIIEEQSEEAASTILEQPTLSRRQEPTRPIVQMRRDIIKDYERTIQVEEWFQELVKTLQEEVEEAGVSIDAVRGEKYYQKFTAQRLVMSEILTAESLRDVDLIINELSFFRSIVLRLNSVFGKTKVLAELKRYRGFNFDRFVEDTNSLAQQERRNGESLPLKNQYRAYEQRFLSSHNEYNTQFQARVGELQTNITELYYLQQANVEEGRNRRGKGDLFQKKYYQILMNAFFLNKQENFNYLQNPHLKKFSDHINANRIQQMMTLTGFHPKKDKPRMKMGCCGLVRVDEEEEEAKCIDEFNCALKDGLILVQGKLRLFENYLNFSSKFNSKTIFGYSDIRIPKWDINAFSEDRHLLSAMVVVETKHGALHFTNFLNYPFALLQSTYSNRKSGVTVAEHPHGDSELQILQARFQGELRGVLKRRGITIDKLSTYLSEGGESLSICLEYHLAATQDGALFEIKINYSELQLEYMLIHDETQKNQEVRRWLEQAAKQLINRKDEEAPLQDRDRPPANNLSLDFEYSIIQPNERNKISFLKEPSFLHRKSENEDFLRSSHVECGQLLTSRNFLSNPETSKNIELLEQRILMSDNNDDTLDRHPPHSKTTQFLTEQPEHTLTTTPAPKNSHDQQGLRLKAMHSPRNRSRVSTATSMSSKQAFDYRTIFLLLGILLGVNLILNAMF